MSRLNRVSSTLGAPATAGGGNRKAQPIHTKARSRLMKNHRNISAPNSVFARLNSTDLVLPASVRDWFGQGPSTEQLSANPVAGQRSQFRGVEAQHDVVPGDASCDQLLTEPGVGYRFERRAAS